MSKKLMSLADMFGEKEGSTTSLKDILGTDGTGSEDKKGIVHLELSLLAQFKNHPFKLYEGDRLNDMVESIKEHGVLLPLIVRPIEKNFEGKEYEILSGHNRTNASRIAGLEKVPVIIKYGLTDEEAMLIVTETNLKQRSFSDLSHSERASVLTEHYNAIKQQGKRTDLLSEIEMLSNADNFNEKYDSCQIGTNGRTDGKTGEVYNLSARVVSRYLRINYLNSELKERLDSGEIPFIAAVDLSFLKNEEQELLEELLQDNPSYKLDIKKADMIKSLSLGRSLTEERMEEILSGKYFKSNKPKSKAVKLKPKLLKRFFKEEQPAEIERIIEEALELYFNKDN